MRWHPDPSPVALGDLPPCGHQGAARGCAGAQVVSMIKAQIVLHDIETALPPVNAGGARLITGGGE